MGAKDELKGKLECWKVDPAVPSGFQREVWQRIALRAAARQQSGWRHLGRSFFELMATPRYASAALVMAIVIGAGAAQVASQENARRWNDLQARYATSIDPVAQALHR